MAVQASSAGDEQHELILAVDAGGTKTAACLATSVGGRQFQVLGRGKSTSGNPLSAGFDAATYALQMAISAAHAEAKQPLGTASKAVLSVAGAANPAVAGQVAEWAKSANIAREIAVISDILPILAAGSDDFTGIALIAGTGSVTFGRAKDGRTIRRGGWGYLLGDEGSGYALGRAALRLALDSLETGETNRSPLIAAVLEKCPAANPAELARHIYNSEAPRSVVAAISPVVTQFADANDNEALHIINDAATELSRLVARTAQLLTLELNPFNLALSGGVLANCQSLRDALAKELVATKLHANAHVVTDPLEGCLRLADVSLAGELVRWYHAKE